MNNFTAEGLKEGLNKKLLFSIMQLLDEEGLKETAHKLERESRLYFNMKYLEDLVLAGKWDDAETYLSGFTKIDGNDESPLIYFELRKQKYIEALNNNDRTKALDILMKDLAFASQSEDVIQVLYNELPQLLILNNIWEHPSLSTFGNAISWRRFSMNHIKQLIEENPKLSEKLQFPSIDSQTLRKHLPTVLKLW